MAGSLGGFAMDQSTQQPASTTPASQNGFVAAAQPGFQNPGSPGGAASLTPGAPQAAGGPTTNNEMTQGFNTNYITPGVSAVHEIAGGPAYDQRVTDDYYKQQTRNLDPQWQQRQGDQDAQLANMGLSRGSAAWQRESDNLSRQRNDAYQTAQSDAIQRGGAESSRLQNAEIARGNFANQAGQQDYQNQITSQNTQNAGNTAQQNAAQGWEGFRTQRYGADQGLKGAEANAAAAQANSQAAQATARENAQLQFQLGTRQQEMAERGQTFNQTLRMEQDPYIMQNLISGGQYPTGNAPQTALNGGQSDQSNYAQQIGAANNQTAQGYGSMASLGGGLLTNQNMPWMQPSSASGPLQLGGSNY